MQPYLGRIVVLLTPIIAGISGWIVSEAAKVLPGTPAIDGNELTLLFVAGTLTSGAAIYKWLENLAKHHENETLKELATPVPPDDVAVVPPGLS